MKTMYTLGIHKEGESIKIALIHFDKKKIQVDLLRSFSDNGEESVKPLYILEPILSGRNVTTVTGLDGWNVFIRELPFTLSKKSAVLATLPFQAESFLPYSIEEAIVLPFFYPLKKNGSLVNVFSTKQISLEEHITDLEAHQVDSDIVSCTPQALSRFGNLVYPELSSFCFFHLGKNKCLFGLSTEKRVVISQTLKWGSENFATSPEQCGKDLQRMFLFIKQKSSALIPRQLILTGHIPQNIKENLQTILQSSFDILPLLNYDPEYAIPLGLAIEGQTLDSHTVQFRQGKYASQKNIKKQKKNLLAYTLLWCGVTLFTFLGSWGFSAQKEKMLNTRINTYALPLKMGPFEGSLENSVALWEKMTLKAKAVFPYIPNVPKVSDVLAWLSTHPLLIAQNEENEGINIKNFEYSLIKYPKLGMSHDPYKAKVMIEFTASSPRAARAWRDALTKTEMMVDHKEEITWKVTQNLYQASFHLNPRFGE